MTTSTIAKTSSTMAKKMMSASTGKVYHCVQCDALCDNSHRVQSTHLKDICMGRVPVATEKTTKCFCSSSCMKHYMLREELQNLNKLLNFEIRTAKRTSELFREMKQSKERILEHEEQVLSVWKSSQFNIKLFQACLDREPVQRLILLQAKSLQYLGEVLEHFHEDSEMLETVLKKIKLIQELHLDLLGS